MRVLVTGVGGGVGQSVMKALRASSLAPYVIAADAEPLAAGLYRADAAALVPVATDPAYVEAVVAIARRHSVNAIIPGSDPELPVLARSRESIEAATGAVVIVSDPLTVEIGWDKARTVAFLKEQGLAFPRSATDLGEARTLGRDNGYPLVVKPRFGSASRGVVTVADENELERAWSATADPIAQERLNGDECTCGTFVDRDGIVRGVIVLRRTLAGGATYRAAVERNAGVEAYISQIATALRARGPVNVQLRVGPTGPVAFEFNPRFSGTTGARTAAGFNEVEAALRHWVLGEPVGELTGRPMTILRYWNEVFVSTDRVAELRSTGEIGGGPSGELRPWP
jgi:carbamoyl-phosphate synthase large subunit